LLDGFRLSAFCRAASAGEFVPKSLRPSIAALRDMMRRAADDDAGAARRVTGAKLSLANYVISIVSPKSPESHRAKKIAQAPPFSNIAF